MMNNVKSLRRVCLLVCLLATALLSFAQNKITVTGKITDNNGQPLDGVTVQEKGTTTSAVSTKDGSYHIPVASVRSVLILSYVGFEEQEVAVGNQKQINVSMKPATNSMNEVVVIGYGTSKRRDVSGAVASFNAKGLEEKPVTRIDQAMIGQMSGVQVRQQTSMPGQGLNIVVRGTGSISGSTEPLYVVDGFPLDVVGQNSAGGYTANPLNSLNPDDIESIQVLKDASASAIYGSRAANGVVMITTKRGQIGRAKITVNVNGGVSSLSRKVDLLSPEEWIAMSQELADYKWVNSGTGRTASQTNAERRAILGLAANAYNYTYMGDDRWYQPGHPGLTYVDWQDEVFRNAPFQNYQVSASGGTEAVRYYFSGGYTNQNGILLNSGYKNYSARANVEVNASKRLKLGINLAPSYSVTNTPSAEGKDNQLMKMYSMAPMVEDSAGLETGAGKNNVYGWSTSSISPVAYLNNTIGQSKTNRILTSIYGEFQILKGLSIRSTLNYDDQNLTRKAYTSDYVAGNITNYLNTPGKSSSGSFSGNKKQTFVTENTINYNNNFGKDHSLSAVAGYTYSSVHSEAFTMSTAGGFANDVVTTLNGAIASSAGVTITGNTTESNNTMISYYGRAIYTYKDKYVLQGSVRRDGSSRFNEDARWGTFPAASFAWRISQEKFMNSLTFINDMKLRASWGRSGSYNVGDYATQQTFAASNYSFGGTVPVSQPGVVVSSLTDPTLHWETSNTYNGGVDVSFLNSRINFIADAYVKKSTDLFMRVPVLAATGFNTVLSNIGQVKNSGLEFTVNTVNIRKKDFQWTTSANISFNKNKVLSLTPGSDAPINIPSAYSGNPPFLLQIGLPMYSYYLIKSVGTLTDKDIADASVAKLTGQVAGDLKYFDANKDGKIDASDRVIAGQPNPKYIWGFTNNFRYKNFDLNVQMYGQHGGTIYSFLARAVDNPANGRATTLGVWRDRWTASNPNSEAPRGKIGYNYTIPLFTTDWLYSSDFWRVQDITLGYSFKGLFKPGVLNNARAYVSLQNFLGHDKYKGGGNPEAQNTNVSGSSDYPLPGDYGSMPLSKTITFGLNLTF